MQNYTTSHFIPSGLRLPSIVTVGPDMRSRFSIVEMFKNRRGTHLFKIGENWGEKAPFADETVEYTLKQTKLLERGAEGG